MLNEFRKWSIILLILLSIMECIIFYSLENIIGCVVLIYGWILLSVFVYKRVILLSHPVIFIMALGLGLFYYYFPLVGTLLNNRSLTHGFRVPYDVFFHQFIYVNSFVMAFLLYTKSKLRPFALRRILYKIKVFEVPSDKQLWLMGFIGMGIYLYVRIGAGFSQMEFTEVSPLLRFLMPMINFVYAPILLLFKPLYKKVDEINNKSINALVFIYISCVVIMSFLGNSRQFMITSIIFLGLLFVFNILYRDVKIKEIISFKKIILISLLVFIIMGPLTKMAQAMVLVRGLRTEISAKELFVKTLEAYSTVEQKEDIYENRMLRNMDWSEDYTGNVFFDRLCNLRVSDMTLYFVKIAKEENIKHPVLYNQFISQIPTPLLNFMGLKFDKYDILSTYSVSSLVRYDLTGSGSGGKSVASHTGTGLYIWGYYYPLIFVIVYFLLFTLLDSFVLITSSQYKISLLFYLNIYFFFTFLNYKNGVVSDLLFLTRPYIQLCFMYVVVFYMTGFAAKLLKKT